MQTDIYYLKNYKISKSLGFWFRGMHIQFKPLLSNKSSSAILTIIKKDDQSTEQIAIGCINLIGFGFSRNIIFDKSYQGKHTKNQIRKKTMVPCKSGGYPIIKEDSILDFLQMTLEEYLQLNKKTEKVIFMCFDYLCQTNSGYLEDRILRTAQCWEIIASHFLKEKIELPTEILEYKRTIKSEYKKWKKKVNIDKLDPNGSMGNSISNLFNSEKYYLKMFKLCQLADFDPNSIELDLKELKRLRDAVAHTGEMDINGQKAIQILRPANYAI